MAKYDLSINGIKKPIKDLSYDDLIWLFNNYIALNNKIPTFKECITKNNLPHGRVINKILNDNNITYNDFLNMFGKVSHVRTENKNYDIYLQRYKEISGKKGKGLTIKELNNNSFGLPSASWFVKYCPNKDVKTFNDFVLWCGFESNELKRDKEDVSRALIDLENQLGRPITKKDINKKDIGFSIIVINRIWGGLNNCKEELGLLKTPPCQPKPFDYYKQLLDDFIIDNKIKAKGFTTWKEIKDLTTVNHRTFVKSFLDNNDDIYKYLASQGIKLNPNSFGYSKILPSGEKIVSSYEYKFSSFLNDIGYIYNMDYKRDVPYKNFLFLDKKSKINCDYGFNNNYYIEIAGLISNKNNDWDKCKFTYKKHYDYQQKMIMKRKLLEENGINYLFLFPEDFQNGLYKEKFYKFIRR